MPYDVVRIQRGFRDSIDSEISHKSVGGQYRRWTTSSMGLEDCCRGHKVGARWLFLKEEALFGEFATAEKGIPEVRTIVSLSRMCSCPIPSTGLRLPSELSRTTESGLEGVKL